MRISSQQLLITSGNRIAEYAIDMMVVQDSYRSFLVLFSGVV
jgi:hypothetical protein